MICPYCFKTNWYKIQQKKGSRLVYYCFRCKSELPKTFYELPEIPYTKIGMLGYSGHGKTTYTAAMLYTLNSMNKYWEQYNFETLDDHLHHNTSIHVNELLKGKLLAGTRAVYPRPVFFLLKNIPYFQNRFVGLFDTGGQLFENLELMTRKGRYFTHSNVIFFFVSLSEKDMKDIWNIKIMKLLDRYIHVIYSRYGTKTSKKQHIAFIISKADEFTQIQLEQKIPDDLIDYYQTGSAIQYSNINQLTLSNINQNSDNIESYLRSSNCNSFINYAKDHFKSVRFMINSSLTKENSAKDDVFVLKPLRILDPLIWALNV